MRNSLDRLRLLGLGASLLALTACMDTRNLDWDMRAGGGDTSDAARQATAAAPTADANGILSYPDYQLAKARRGELTDADITRAVVDIKCDIEKIREQIQNIE